MLSVPSSAVFGPNGKTTGAVADAVVLHGLIGLPSNVADQEILRFVPSSTMLSIFQVNRLPSLTDLSSPSQMMPTRSVSRPLWKSATVAGSSGAWWQFVHTTVASAFRWKFPAGKPKPAIEPWQLRQPS